MTQARTQLNTILRFGMLETGCAVKKAVQKDDVKFDRASKNGNKLKRIERDEITLEEVADDVQYGVRNGDDFTPINADALEAIKAEGAIDDIEIEEFVSLKDFESTGLHRIEGSYFITPQTGGVGRKVLKYLFEALRREKAIGLSKTCLKRTGGRQYLVGIYADTNKEVLRLLVLSFADAERQVPEGNLEEVEVQAKTVTAARSLVKALTVPVAESKLLNDAVDDAVPAKLKLYEAALEGQPIKAKDKAAPVEARPVDDIMEALERSIEKASKVKTPA